MSKHKISSSETGAFRTTTDGKYSEADASLALIYGYDSPDDLIHSLTDISRQLYLDPGRRKEFARLMRKHGEVKDFESPIRRKDGQVIWISENAREIRDGAGKIVGYEGTVTDITAQKGREK